MMIKKKKEREEDDEEKEEEDDEEEKEEDEEDGKKKKILYTIRKFPAIKCHSKPKGFYSPPRCCHKMMQWQWSLRAIVYNEHAANFLNVSELLRFFPKLTVTEFRWVHSFVSNGIFDGHWWHRIYKNEYTNIQFGDPSCSHGLESRSERRFRTWFGPFLIWKPDLSPCKRKAVSNQAFEARFETRKKGRFGSWSA